MKRRRVGVSTWIFARKRARKLVHKDVWSPRAPRAPRTPPPPAYWQTADDEEGGAPRTFHTKYMRRKLEYLLRNCATHPDGCLDKKALREARVVEVQRIENHMLWRRYADRLAEMRPSGGKEERSAPIRCQKYEGERFLFHGTRPEFLASIAQEGLKIGSNHSRYGQGIYFSDESCKAHQYARCRKKEDGSLLYCLLYCRVLPGRTLQFKASKKDAMCGFLYGMQRPSPKDKVFRAAMLRRGATIKAKQHFQSLDIVADQRGVARGGDPAQIHRELVVFDERRVRKATQRTM